jgi:hypothetical protein
MSLHEPQQASTAADPIEIIRAWLFTYTKDRLGRDASPAARFLAHDALEELERQAGR